MGIRKQTAYTFAPVRSVTVADPPRINIVDTMILVERPKNRKTRCATVPHLARMISRNLTYAKRISATNERHESSAPHVWAFGAFSLILAAIIAKSNTCTVAPAAYLNEAR